MLILIHKVLQRIGIVTLVMLAAQVALGVNPSKTVYEVDGISQNGRPVTFGMLFVDGDITANQYPQPQISGQSITSWQADCKNFYASGSPRFCIVSYVQPTMASSTGYIVTFASNANTCSSCTGGTASGYRTQAQLTTDIGTGASIGLNPAGGGTGFTTALATVLGHTDPVTDTECGNRYWLKGPVVTAVIVQDCTSASTYDGGWHWDGTTMNANAGNPYTGNNQYASLHPWFIIYDYPSISATRVDFVVENGWTGRAQDQLADIILKVGASTVWSHVGARKLTDVVTTSSSATITSATANFTSADVGLPILIYGQSVNDWYTIASVTNSTTATLSANCCQGGTAGSAKTAYINLQTAGTSHRKTFWIGTAPGNVRIDHNFSYLISTKAFPNYDLTVTPTADSSAAGATPWSTWVTGDKGDIGGWGQFPAWTKDYAANAEIAPEQRENLEYLYNMSSCGTVNSQCAKAWDKLSGEVDSNASSTLSSGAVSGGGGAWNNFGNVPFHWRESQTAATGQISTGNSFYCPNLADKNADPTNTTACGIGQGTATGKPFSVYAHSNQGIGFGAGALASVGTIAAVPGGWAGSGCSHWLDYISPAYALTGDYWALEEVYQSASYCAGSSSPSNCIYCRNGFFGFSNPNGSILRETAGGIQTYTKAAYYAPDGTPESAYYLSLLNSNYEVLEGFLGVTGTSLSPTDTSCSSNVVNYDYRAANRWNWAACTVRSTCQNTGTGTCTVVPNSLKMLAAGTCPVSGDPAAIVDTTKASAYYFNWAHNVIGVFSFIARGMGLSGATEVSNQVGRQLENIVLDSTSNPFLVALGNAATRNIATGSVCSGSYGQNTDAFFSSYSSLQAADYASQSGSTYNIASISRSGNTTTVTLASGTNPGNQISVQGVSDSSFDTSCATIFGSGSSFSYYNPGANGSSSGGTVTIVPACSLNFDKRVGNGSCGDHAYSDMARALGSYLQEYSVSDTNANCPSGICSASGTWGWINGYDPFWNNTPTVGNNCVTPINDGDAQIKWSLTPATLASSNGSIRTPNTIRTAGTVMQ